MFQTNNTIMKNEYCFKCNKITETENEKLEVFKEYKLLLKGKCKDCKNIKILNSIKSLNRIKSLNSIKHIKKPTNIKLLF